MKARIIAIILLIGLGIMVPLKAAGASNIFDPDSPSQKIHTGQFQVEDLSAYIQAQMLAYKVPGLSIALIQEGEIVWVEGFGETNTLTGRPVAGDTVFEVASISKVIAAVAALSLVERGDLSLDEPVHNYLSRPWLPSSAYADQITLRQLLSHTTGLTNSVNPVNKSIIFPPGDHFLYSGVGFIYLQDVMEQVTGESLEQIAQEMVFEPLEMDSSSYVIPRNILPRLAYGHIRYGQFISLVAQVLVLVFILSMLVGMIIQRIRLKKFSLPGKLLWICFLIAASLVLAFVIVFANGTVNKWVMLTVLWLIFFGGCMSLLLYAGRMVIFHLSGKWQKPKIQGGFLAFWFIISALGLLLLSNALSGPIPRLPAGSPNAAYSLRTTASDLAKLLLELTSPGHLDPTLMAEMTLPQIQMDEEQAWGLGIGILHNPQGTFLWHDGNNPDVHSLMIIDQNQRNGVVLLTNGENGMGLVYEIASHILGFDFGPE
jgi:CubicO group peptidase (beta-lactamase class C family)